MILDFSFLAFNNIDVESVSTNLKLNIAGWSSLVARRAHNPKVVGSNPAPATIYKKRDDFENIKIISFILYSVIFTLLNMYTNPLSLIIGNS